MELEMISERITVGANDRKKKRRPFGAALFCYADRSYDPQAPATFSAICGALRPYSFITSSGLPDWPNTSCTPILW